jgi:hypothetical protein
MWPINQRVLAQPDGKDDWLPGTVRHVDGARHYVIFDSGDDGWFPGDQLRPAEAVPRVDVQPRRLEIGDRVLARWRGDLLWYPGTYANHENGYHIVFDDQDQAIVAAADILPLVVQEGDRVLCRPKFERELRYFPAEVTRVAGEVIDVAYDSLELQETNTNVSRIRIQRSASGGIAWEEGDRALVSGRDGFHYPAVILVVDGDRLYVSLLDSRHAWVLPEEVRALRVSPGSTVQVRRGAAAEYQPAVIVDVEGEVLQVRYTDGAEETTLLRLVRVPLEAVSG